MAEDLLLDGFYVSASSIFGDIVLSCETCKRWSYHSAQRMSLTVVIKKAQAHATLTCRGPLKKGDSK